MATIYPNMSQLPLHRRHPKKKQSPFKAYRVWGLQKDFDADDWWLTSVVIETAWESPVLRAHVRPYDAKHLDERPIGDHTRGETFVSGIYALKTKELAWRVFYTYTTAKVIGEVDLWGRVIEFEEGYRSEWCMINKLWIPSLVSIGSVHRKRVVRSLESRYQCDVEEEGDGGYLFPYLPQRGIA